MGDTASTERSAWIAGPSSSPPLVAHVAFHTVLAKSSDGSLVIFAGLVVEECPERFRLLGGVVAFDGTDRDELAVCRYVYLNSIILHP